MLFSAHAAFMIRNSHGILLLIHDIDDIRRTQNALAQANNQLNLFEQHNTP